jgi:uracil-DNA glycosylase
MRGSVVQFGSTMLPGQSIRTRILADGKWSGTAIERSTDIRRVRAFVSNLSAFPSSRTLVNPYRSRRRRQNLETYLLALLAWPYSGHLLVGEARGERGCARTGIPFIDERLLRSGGHPFLESLRPAVKVAGSTTENTAGIVWRHLSHCGQVPAFWNAVPFHPRSDVRPNRAPTAGEVLSCQVFLNQILRVLAPHSVIAVGRTAEIALKRLGVKNFDSVRHPSHGGKRAYIDGLTSAGLSAPSAG